MALKIFSKPTEIPNEHPASLYNSSAPPTCSVLLISMEPRKESCRNHRITAVCPYHSIKQVASTVVREHPIDDMDGTRIFTAVFARPLSICCTKITETGFYQFDRSLVRPPADLTQDPEVRDSNL
jgi:hypothetical protein